MRYIYKIYSGYDGFTPEKIPIRLTKTRAKGRLIHKVLRLRWHRYLDEVEEGNECWVFFHGRGVKEDGVYAKGRIRRIDRRRGYAWFKVKKYSITSPITHGTKSAQIAQLVSVKYRQVFPWPEKLPSVLQCNHEACRNRLCGSCSTWRKMKIIKQSHVNPPARAPLDNSIDYVPAYWVIPSRCYLNYKKRIKIRRHVDISTDFLKDFKLGEKAFAYPLALGIYYALRKRHHLDFDVIIPIPLSPNKIRAGEIHRTLLLAKELSRFLKTPVRQSLILRRSISKRKFIGQGHTKSEFEEKYYEALKVKGNVFNQSKILLVDDVMTHGSTVSQAISRLREKIPDASIVVASAAQMIVKEAVRNLNGIAR
jgi:predicted amidophosphoribosyltransferase